MQQPTLQDALDQALRHHSLGQLKEAESLYRHIVAREPRHAVAMHHLGMVAYQTGRHQLAVDLLRQAIGLNPNWPEAHSNLGHVLRENGQFDDAIGACRKAIAIRPDYPEAFNNLGYALESKGESEEAITALRQAITLRPNFPEAYNNLGNALKSNGQIDEATSAFRQAIALKPNFAEPHNNLGTALMGQGRLDEAVASIREAIAVRSNYTNGYNNLGLVLKEKGNVEAAISAFRQAIELRQDSAEAHTNLAMALLAQGDLQSGWREYEWRWKSKDFQPRLRNFAQPQWDGSPLNGRTLLLHTEQGFGDTIQFIRYLPLVLGKRGKIVVECQRELERLLKTMPFDFEHVIRGQPLPAFDVHCPLLSLPRLFDTTLENLPNAVPYMKADAEDVRRWRQRLDGHRANVNVGLVWAGRSDHKSDRNRSTELAMWMPLTKIPGTRFFSLRKREKGEKKNDLSENTAILDWTSEINDFADTAAFMANMDLIITVDTAAAHLAGAMGKPAWTLLRFAADWRWFLKREDSPWYPTMRLFRQRTPGDWQNVVDRVGRALAEFKMVAQER